MLGELPEPHEVFSQEEIAVWRNLASWHPGLHDEEDGVFLELAGPDGFWYDGYDFEGYGWVPQLYSEEASTAYYMVMAKSSQWSVPAGADRVALDVNDLRMKRFNEFA